jgi:PIN domain nuclease of toxin-antitoxin system
MGQALVILVDTHVVVWLSFEPGRISEVARAAIDDARKDANGLAISDVTLLEMARLASAGRIRSDLSVEALLQEVESRFVVLPMNGRICARAVSLPASLPKDLADRVIVATALVEGMPLITADREIRRSKVVRTIW